MHRTRNTLTLIAGTCLLASSTATAALAYDALKPITGAVERIVDGDTRSMLPACASAFAELDAPEMRDCRGKRKTCGGHGWRFETTEGRMKALRDDCGHVKQWKRVKPLPRPGRPAFAKLAASRIGRLAALDGFAAWAVETGAAIGLTLERIDDERDYEPSNCQWLKSRPPLSRAVIRRTAAGSKP